MSLAIRLKNVMSMKKTAFVAIGGNLVPDGYHSVSQVMAEAVDTLADGGLTIVKSSRWYETAPVPISDQPWFLNAVLQIETELSPRDLLAKLHEIEHEFGRVRKVRNEARILDLDIIDYDGQVIEAEDIILPHPRMHDRAFVLLPVSDLDNKWQHPVLAKSVSELIDQMPQGQDIRLKGE